MADLEIRAFGKRFLMVFDSRPEPDVSEPDAGTTAGDFSPAPAGNESWRDSDVLVQGFGFEVK